jgi:hypothetical protein
MLGPSIIGDLFRLISKGCNQDQLWGPQSNESRINTTTWVRKILICCSSVENMESFCVNGFPGLGENCVLWVSPR